MVTHVPIVKHHCPPEQKLISVLATPMDIMMDKIMDNVTHAPQVAYHVKMEIHVKLVKYLQPYPDLTNLKNVIVLSEILITIKRLIVKNVLLNVLHVNK